MEEVPNELKFQQYNFDKRAPGRPQFTDLLILPASFWADRSDKSLRSYVAKRVQSLVAQMRADGF
jgi:hypothetical protein